MWPSAALAPARRVAPVRRCRVRQSGFQPSDQFMQVARHTVGAGRAGDGHRSITLTAYPGTAQAGAMRADNIEHPIVTDVEHLVRLRACTPAGLLKDARVGLADTELAR